MATSTLLAKLQARITAAQNLRAAAESGAGVVAPTKAADTTGIQSTATTTSGLHRLNERIAAAKARDMQAKEDTFVMPGLVVTGVAEFTKQLGDRQSLGMDGNIIELNDEQYDVCQVVSAGEDVVVIGPAGSGKSTTQRAAAIKLMQSGRIPTIKNTNSHKWLTANRPGIIVCSYTRRAVNNIRKILPPELQNNCMTIHRLLEFAPTDVTSDELTAKGELKTSRVFLPQRHRANPLTSEIHTIVIEEAGMVSTELFAMLLDALPKKVQFVFLGDIYQLPPPMGSAILGYKMNEHKVVALSRVYRTGEDSPILSLAHRIKDGIFIKAKPQKVSGELHPRYPVLDNFEKETNGVVTIKPWRTKVDPMTCNVTVKNFMIREMAAGRYDPETDVILCPYEKELSSNHEELVSTVNINKHIANHLGKERGAEVYEIISGVKKHYFAVGDKVMYEKMDMEIVSIERNPKYLGGSVRVPSKDLDRWGTVTGQTSYEYSSQEDQIAALASVDDIFNLEADDLSNQASHVLKLRHLKADAESGEEAELVELCKAGDVNGLLFGYALTVYKSQGSEWRNVYLVLHFSQARHTSNEMLYTAVTRAKKQLTVLCEPETFENGIKNRVIKGKSLAEKAEFFKGKAERLAANTEASGMIKILNRKLAQETKEAETLVAMSVETLP